MFGAALGPVDKMKRKEVQSINMTDCVLLERNGPRYGASLYTDAEVSRPPFTNLDRRLNENI